MFLCRNPEGISKPGKPPNGQVPEEPGTQVSDPTLRPSGYRNGVLMLERRGKTPEESFGQLRRGSQAHGSCSNVIQGSVTDVPPTGQPRAGFLWPRAHGVGWKAGSGRKPCSHPPQWAVGKCYLQTRSGSRSKAGGLGLFQTQAFRITWKVRGTQKESADRLGTEQKR